MAILDTALLILGAIGGRELLAAGVPKAIEAWRKSRESDAQVDIAKAQANEREITAQHRTDRAGIDFAARVMEAREVDHADCRREVAALRLEVRAASEAVDDCQSKHRAAEERIDAQDSQILDLRGVLEWMKGQLDRIERRSNPPEMEPAE